MSNSNQEIIEARLATYVDGELDPAERGEIEAYLRQNPQHRRLLEELKRGRDLLRGLPRQAAPSEFADAFASQLERSVLLDGEGREDQQPQMRIGAGPRMFAAAAILFLTFGLATIVYFVLPGRRMHQLADTRPVPQPLRVSPAATSAANAENLDELSEKRKRVTDTDSQEQQDGTPARQLASKDENAGNRKVGDGSSSPDAAAVPAPLAINHNAVEGPKTPAPQSDLELLARNVAEDQQVKDLLGAPAANVRLEADSVAAPNDALVMVVKSNDPLQIQQELNAYFRAHGIDWQAAQPSPGLATSTVQQNAQAGQNAAKSDQAADRDALQAKKGQAPGSPSPAVTRPADRDNRTKEMRSATSVAGAKPAASQSTFAKTAMPPAGNAGQGPAAGGAAAARPIAPASAPTFGIAPAALPATSPEAADAIAPRDLKNPPTTQLAGNQWGVSTNSMYVARRLSRQQAQDLNAYLARSGQVMQAHLSRSADDGAPRANETTFRRNVGAGNDDGRTLADAALAQNQPAAGALQGDKQNVRMDQAAGRAGAGGGAGSAKDSPVRAGDTLTLKYAPVEAGARGQSETLRVKADGTIEPQAAPVRGRVVQADGRTTAELEKALAKAGAIAGADGPADGVKIERVAAAASQSARPVAAAPPAFGATTAPTAGAAKGEEEAKLRSGAKAAFTPITSPSSSRPVSELTDAKAWVDVVIVVQNEAGPATAAATPAPVRAATQLPATPLPPTRLPATRPAVPPPAPATQPVPPIRAAAPVKNSR